MAAKAQNTEAQYYSGTFEWSETLDARIGSGGDRSESTRTVNISMVITAGHVQCYGSVNEKSQRWSSGLLEEDRLARGDMEGIGLVSVEFGEGGIHSVGGEEVELDDDAPSYNITIACPSPTMTVTGGGETETTPAEAASWGSSWEIQTYDWPGDFSRPGLKGSTTWDHGEVEPALATEVPRLTRHQGAHQTCTSCRVASPRPLMAFVNPRLRAFTNLPRWILESLVARRPSRALLMSAARLGVCGLRVRLPPTSPLFSAAGGQCIELPVDRIIAPFVLDHGQWQAEELDFIGAHLSSRPAILIDIGANIGLVTRQLLHRLPQIAAAVCYEPQPTNFHYLQRNLAHLPQCHLVQAALGQTDGELQFYEDVSNAGNYSLSPDAMRGSEFRTTSVKCLRASDEQLLAPLPAALRESPIVWKSDTQGFDQIIMTGLSESFWRRVQVGVMEIWRIEHPPFDRRRFREILEGFSVRRFSDRPDTNVAVDEILAYGDGTDYQFRDLFFARA
jgi:FkbM family methyltransferase